MYDVSTGSTARRLTQVGRPVLYRATVPFSIYLTLLSPNNCSGRGVALYILCFPGNLLPARRVREDLLEQPLG